MLVWFLSKSSQVSKCHVYAQVYMQVCEQNNSITSMTNFVDRLYKSVSFEPSPREGFWFPFHCTRMERGLQV